MTREFGRGRLRWYICILLLASTVINYLDRQTLSLLAPSLKSTYKWTNSDYANLVIGFRIAYGIGQSLVGRWIDRLGTRRAISWTVVFYSTIALLTPLARGLHSFAFFRILLGFGESANWPAATKAVSEWFPASERALATAVFDSGSSIGAAIAPFVVLWSSFHFGWRASFILPGLLGYFWLILWRKFYYRPEDHPRISAQELKMLQDDKVRAGTQQRKRVSIRTLLGFRQTWGVIAARSLTDPVWYFVTDWFPIYLVAKGIDLRSGLIAIWVPFLAADLGNFSGGAFSGWLIRRGWSVGWARKAVVIVGACGTTLLIATTFTHNILLLTCFFAVATYSYACFSTVANVLPSDLYQPDSVATVSGLSGAASAFMTVIAMKIVGYVSDARYSAGTAVFDPIMIVSGCIPCVGMILVLLLVRNTRATDDGDLLRL